MRKREGIVILKGKKGITPEQYFQAFLSRCKEEPSGCVIYQGYHDKDGYGRFYNGITQRPAHVYLWEQLFGPVPSGKQFNHNCDNPACCNYKHLYLGTQSDNMDDRMMRQTYNTVTCAHPALYEGEIWLLRKLISSHKFSQAFLAKVFKIHRETIGRISRSKTYLCKEGYYV